MKSSRFRRSGLAAAIAATFLPGLAVPASAPIGSEFRVNSFTTNSQSLHAVAVDAGGDFVVTWTSSGQDGSGYGVYAQRYSASGVPRGIEFRVNSYATGNQRNPSVALDGDGDFVIAWQSSGQDGSGDGIYAQRYSAGGAPLGDEFRVNSYTDNAQNFPSVAMAPDGDFVVAWESAGGQDGSDYGIYAQRYGANGQSQGGEFRVNSYTSNLQREPQVAVAADGDFVVVWNSLGQDGSGYGVYAQRYDAAATPQGIEFRVNSFTDSGQTAPTVAMAADGDFMVVWSSFGQDDSSFGITAQRYRANGVRLGTEFRFNSYTTGSQRFSSVAASADGDFVVAWQSQEQDSLGYGVYALRFGADGVPQSTEFRVNSFITENQRSPSVAVDADGDFVVAWSSFGQDGGFDGIYAQRYRGDEAADLDLSLDGDRERVPGNGQVRYTARLSNLAAPRFDTGIAVIDEALGSALTPRLSLVLPPEAGVIQAPVSPDALCIPRSSGYRCDLNQPLPAGGSIDIGYTLQAPAQATVLSTVAAASTPSFEEDLSNNRDRVGTRVDCVPSTVSFTLDAYSAGENLASASIGVVRDPGSCGEATRVQVDTANGSATAGLDFIDTTATLSWAVGESSFKNVVIPLLGDSLDELDERVALSLSGVEGGRIGSVGRARLLITDNDPSPRVNFTSHSQSRPESETLATLTVQLSALSGRNVVVPLTRSGTATLNTDYFQSETAITIPAGSRSASIDIEIVDDALDESDETVILSLGTPTGAVAGTASSHALTITDDDEPLPMPSVSFTTAVSSGDETITRTAALQLSAASSQTITVPYTVSGTAAQGADYSLSRPSPITFNPGVTQVGIQSLPVDDALDEPNETVILTLGTPVNATLGATTVHTRTIADND